MPTTTQITNITDKLDLTTYAGDFASDYDMDAVHADYVEALDELLPEGIHLYASGDVIADVDLADQARGIDWDELTEQVDVEAIFKRHDRTAELLFAIAEAAAAIERAERARVNAVRVARNSGHFTVDQIAEAAEVTRDAIYKMLARSRPTVTFGTAEKAQWLADLPDLAANGRRGDVDGATVTLTTAALDVLSLLDDDEDGHYDGVHIWVGGTEYRVEG
jgi:hypothetical protein